MTTFFIDLWHDLREKRLWPVAVGLIAAIVAVPAVLFKPASDGAPPAAVTPKTGAADTLPVVAVESGPNVGSKLEAFNEKNPFKPMKDLAKADAGAGAAGSGSGGAGSGGSGSGSGGSGGFGGSGSGSGGTGSGSGGTTSGGTTGSPSTGGGPTTTRTTTWFHYTADFSFGEPGSPKTFKNVGSFQLLPDEKTPSIVFLGIGGDHKSAMFFISDPAFEAGGEGDCNVAGPDCRFVTLKLSDSADEETFTATDGSVSYDLKLLKITRESLGTGKTPDPTPTPKSAKGFGATGAGVATATQSAQSVLPGMFAVGPGVAREQH